MGITRKNDTEVVKAFIDKEKATNRSETFFVEVVDDVSIIFSYGRHFPIAINFRDGFLFNKASYSNTTGKQKYKVKLEIEYQLSDDDYKTTKEIKQIVEDIKYKGIRSKAELIEHAI